MKISIITVTYNAEEFLMRTIDSVRSQSFNDVEYIVIDGNSTDNTVKLIKENNDAITFWLSEDDNGLYEAMNKGVQHASGDYVIFMNAGDTFSDKDVLDVVQKEIEDCDVVYGDRFYIHQNGQKKLQKARPIETVLERMPFGHQSCLMKRKILLSRPFNTTYKYAADYDLIVDLFLQGKRFKYINSPISNFLSGGKSESGLKPHIEALMVLFNYSNDRKVIIKNQYFNSFKQSANKLFDI